MIRFPFEIHTVAAGRGDLPPRLALTRGAAEYALDDVIKAVGRRPATVTLIETDGDRGAPVSVESWSLNCATAADHAAVRAERARSLRCGRRRRFRPLLRLSYVSCRATHNTVKANSG
jgi:hypothetical protein